MPSAPPLWKGLHESKDKSVTIYRAKPETWRAAMALQDAGLVEVFETEERLHVRLTEKGIERGYR